MVRKDCQGRDAESAPWVSRRLPSSVPRKIDSRTAIPSRAERESRPSPRHVSGAHSTMHALVWGSMAYPCNQIHPESVRSKTLVKVSKILLLPNHTYLLRPRTHSVPNRSPAPRRVELPTPSPATITSGAPTSVISETCWSNLISTPSSSARPVRISTSVPCEMPCPTPLRVRASPASTRLCPRQRTALSCRRSAVVASLSKRDRIRSSQEPPQKPMPQPLTSRRRPPSYTTIRWPGSARFIRIEKYRLAGPAPTHAISIAPLSHEMPTNGHDCVF